MKLIIRAAIRAKHNFRLLIFALVALFFLTLADQMEMLGIGLMTKNSTDFFTLFKAEKGVDYVTSGDISRVWNELDPTGSDHVTYKDAAHYMSSKSGSNPLEYLKHKVQNRFDISSNLRSLVSVLVFVAIFKAFWLFTSRYLIQLLAVRFAKDLRMQYFQHIQTLSMGFYQRFNIGALSSRVVSDSSQIALSINSAISNLFQAPITVISTFSMCLFLSWKLSMIVFVIVPAIVYPIVSLASRIKKVSRKLQSNQERFTSVLIDFLSGIQTVKVFRMEEFSRRKYAEENECMAELEGKTAKYSMMTRPILHAIMTTCLAIVVITGLNVFHLSISEVISFCGMLYLMYMPIKRFADENANIQRGIVAAERMFEVLNIKPEIQDAKDAISLTQIEEEICFDNVSFKYDEQWILKDVSFSVKKGETVALVGPTGSGKSTIVSLLPRLYDVQKGEIRIDGKPISAYTQDSLRGQISFVAQKPFLFLDSIRNNIDFSSSLSDEEVAMAAKRAYADEFIQQLPEKYNTVLRDAGSNLSGGQQQRLAIARALAKKAPLLILDEATSALDSLSENRIKKAIEELHGEVTQIIIAHRLSTIESADRIIYLENGRILAQGTREELLETCPQFKLAWSASTNSTAPEAALNT